MEGTIAALKAHHFPGYRRIAAALNTRIVDRESHFARNHLRPFLEIPCVPILQPGPLRGGYTELRKIAAAAAPWGIGLAFRPDILTDRRIGEQRMKP